MDSYLLFQFPIKALARSHRQKTHSSSSQPRCKNDIWRQIFILLLLCWNCALRNCNIDRFWWQGNVAARGNPMLGSIQVLRDRCITNNTTIFTVLQNFKEPFSPSNLYSARVAFLHSFYYKCRYVV